MKKKAKRKVAPSRGKRRMVEVRFKFPLDGSETCNALKRRLRQCEDAVRFYILPSDTYEEISGPIRAIEVTDVGAR